MHFTREPIIESILSARDGYKLVLKNSKTPSSTEVSAEVIEIVSFAGSVFYRSQDRSKNFLLPASDFEILEVKDARLVLKNISLEKSSKLQNPPKEYTHHDGDDNSVEENSIEASDDAEQASNQPVPAQSSSRLERRRERRRNRRRRHNEERSQQEKAEAPIEASEAVQEQGQDEGDNQPQAVIPTINLIPPPTTLISQTLARYKEKHPEAVIDAGSIVVEDNTTTSSLELPLEPEDLV